MLNKHSRTWLIGGIWFAALAIAVIVSVATGAKLSTIAFLLIVGVAAPAVAVLLVGAAAPSPTVAEMLHAPNAKNGR